MSESNPGPSKAAVLEVSQSSETAAEPIPGPSNGNGRKVISDLVPVSPGSSSSSSSDNSVNQAPVTATVVKIRDEDKEFNSLFEREKFHGLSPRQVQTLLVLALTDFVGAVLLSNQNPWYPIQAGEHEIPAFHYGFVFAIFELSIFVFTPIFQDKMRYDSITPNTLFHVGVFMAATSAILFAFLGYASSPTVFLALSIVFRFFEGIGEAAIIAASFGIIATEFPESLTSTFVSLETFFGVGILVGPALGGALWDAIPGPERFTLTFGTFGGVLFIIAVFGLFTLPRNDRLEDKAFIPGFRMFSVLKVSLIPLSAFTVLSSAISVGMLFVTLSPHLAEFNIPPVLLGGVFLLNGGIAALTSPGFGWIVHRTRRPRLFILLGSTFILTGFLFIGPVSFLPFETTVWMTCIGLIIHGIGMGAIFGSTFKFMLYQAVKYGYANNIATYTIVSSMWTAMFCLGTLIGTATSGALYDWVGFRTSAWLVIDLQAAVILFTLVSLVTSQLGYKPTQIPARGFRSSERQPLLDNQSSPFSFVHHKSTPSLKRVSSEPTLNQDSRQENNYGSTTPPNSIADTTLTVEIKDSGPESD